MLDSHVPVNEMEGDGRGWKAYITQNMRQPRWLLPFSPRLISTCVLCVFLAEVQQDFVVGQERGLGGFDLSIFVSEWVSE